jgi:hypothetical protein
MNEHTPKPRSPAAQRAAEYRRRMREAGYRQVTRWVPDTRRPEVQSDLQQQAQAIADSVDGEAELMKWVESVYAWPEYEWPQKE